MLFRSKGSTVVNVGIRLNNPDELLAWVVEVELNLVGRGTNRLITSELNLLNEVLVRVLGHLSALIRVEEDIVDIEGGRNEGLLVRDGSSHVSRAGTSEGLDGPEALTNGAKIKVDLNLVVLESDQRKGETRVLVPPEKERNVESGLRKEIGRAHV